jgi:hypothetical protein
MTDAEKQLYERVIYHHRNGQLKWEKTIFNDFEAKLNEKITIVLFMDYDIDRSRLRFKSNQSRELFDVVFSKQTGFPEVEQIARSLQPHLPKKVDANDILSMIKSPDEIRQEKIEKILTSTETKSVLDDVTQVTTNSSSSQNREKNIKEILQHESILEKVKRLFIR